MIKIIDYEKYSPSDKPLYSRKEKEIGAKPIEAEKEIEQYLKEGWEIISSNMSALGTSRGSVKFLTVIFYKKDKNV